MDSSFPTMMHAVRGHFRFAHIDSTILGDPAVYARLPKVHRLDWRTQGPDRGGATTGQHEGPQRSDQDCSSFFDTPISTSRMR